IVRVEDIADRLARRLSDLRQDVAHAPRRVCLDHDHEIPELDPAGVRRLPRVAVADPGEDARDNLVHGSALAAPRVHVRPRQQQDRNERKKSSHRVLRRLRIANREPRTTYCEQRKRIANREVRTRELRIANVCLDYRLSASPTNANTSFVTGSSGT